MKDVSQLVKIPTEQTVYRETPIAITTITNQKKPNNLYSFCFLIKAIQFSKNGVGNNKRTILETNKVTLTIKHKIMEYYFSKTITGSFDDAIQKVTEALKAEGFGILTEIDIKETLKKKLDVDFYNYKILGACNPPFAYKALLAEDKIGTMLPCNVIVQEKVAGQVEVSAVDPAASMQAIENSALNEIAQEIRARLQKVIEAL